MTLGFFGEIYVVVVYARKPDVNTHTHEWQWVTLHNISRGFLLV